MKPIILRLAVVRVVVLVLLLLSIDALSAVASASYCRLSGVA
jgi:hypothetical protein